MNNDRTAQFEAVSIEAVQILQEMNAIVSRQAHLIEKMALMMRHDRQIQDYRGTPEKTIPLSDLAKHGPSGKPKGGHTHDLRRQVSSEELGPMIDTRAEMPDRTDMAPSIADLASSGPKEDPNGDLAKAMKAELASEEGPAEAPAPALKAEPEPAAKPPLPPRMYDRILDYYAEHGGGNAAIAKACDSTPNSVSTYLRTARLNSDPRVAKGDLKRQEGTPVVPDTPKPDAAALYRANTQPKTVEPMVSRIGKDEIIRVFDDTKMVDGPDDEVPMRSEAWREILKAMAHQQPMSEATVLKMLGKNFPPNMVWDEIKRTNLALAKTGLVIHSVEGGPVYQLRKLI